MVQTNDFLIVQNLMYFEIFQTIKNRSNVSNKLIISLKLKLHFYSVVLKSLKNVIKMWFA